MAGLGRKLRDLVLVVFLALVQSLLRREVAQPILGPHPLQVTHGVDASLMRAGRDGDPYSRVWFLVWCLPSMSGCCSVRVYTYVGVGVWRVRVPAKCMLAMQVYICPSMHGGACMYLWGG